jgi:hypothetical protein
MKKMTVSLLALTALVGGTMLASAAAKPGDTGATYFERIDFSASSNSVAPSLIEFVDVPKPQVHTNFTVLSRSLDVDTAGKIEGVAIIRYSSIESVTTTEIVTNGDNTTTTNTSTVDTVTGFSDFMCDISGKINNKKTDTAVQMSIKGNGYSSSNSSPDFATVSANVKPAKLSLNFSGTIPTASISSTSTITGTLNGSLSPGLKSINNGKAISFKKEAATVDFEAFTFNNLDIDVVQVGSKLYSAEEDFELTGKGSTTTKNTFSINYKGFGRSRGANLKLSGTTGDLVIGTDSTGTNNIVVPNAPLSGIEAKGKIIGQNIDATGGTATFND